MNLLRLPLFAAMFAALCAASLAQEAPPEEEPPPPALISKTYDFTGLLDLDDPAAFTEGLAPDGVLPDLQPPTEDIHWNVRNARGGAHCWSSAEDAMQCVLTFCTTGEPGTTYSDVTGGQGVTLSCDEELHRRVAWTIEALKAVANIRVKLRAYELPPGQGAASLSAAEAEKLAKGAKLLGSVSGQLGQTLLLQQLKPWDFIQGYELAADGKHSVTRAGLNAGRELVAGSLLLPDGKLWLQACSARLEIPEVRDVQSSCGQVECPRARYSCVPASMLLENGGGAILDEGAHGRTLLVCGVEGTMPNRTLDCGTRTTLGLVNVTSTLRGDCVKLPWLCGAAMPPLKLGSVGTVLPQAARGCILHPATIELASRLSYESEVLGAIVPLGPYLGVRITQAGGDGDASPEEFEAARQRLSETLRSISTGAKALERRVQAWRLKSVPEAIARGAGSAKDFEALGAPAFERSVQSLSGCTLGISDVEIAALIAGDGQTPELGVAAWGAQLECVARESASGTEVDLRLGLVEGERKIKSTEESGMVKFERATRLPFQAQLNGTLGDKALLTCVQPDNDGYLVVAVQRSR